MHIKYSLYDQKDVIVRSLSFNPRHNLACLLISSPSRLIVSEFTLNAQRLQFDLSPPFAEFKLESGNAIFWGADGKEIHAMGNRSVTSFALGQHLGAFFLNKLDYLEDKSELLAFSPTRDEGDFFYGTLEGRVTRVRRRQAPISQQFENKIVALTADPLKRFLAVLTLQNVLTIADYMTLHPDRQIDLSVRKNEVRSRPQLVLCEVRKIDSSPDLRTLLVPTLEDKKLPLAMALSRDRGFDIVSVFGGFFAPITVLKYVPGVFVNGQEELTVFAMGDAHGNIVFWVYGQDKPICLLKSDDFSVTIENIEFSTDCSLMVAITNRRFYITVMIKPSLFGATSVIPKHEFLKSKFGESDLRDFKSVTFKELRQTENKQEISEAPAGPKSVTFRKKNEKVDPEADERNSSKLTSAQQS